MKYLLVIDNLGSGGAQNQLSLLALTLKQKGAQVSVFTYYPQNFFKKRLLDANVELLYKAKTSKLGMEVIFAITSLLKEKSYDIIISYLNTPNLYAILAVQLSGKSIPTIVSYRSKTDFSTIDFWSLKTQEWVNRNATHIICNSHHERANWLRKYPKLIKKISTIYNGLDRTKFRFREMKRADFIVVGKVRPLKNAHQLVEALYILKTKFHHEIFIHWYGGRVFKQKSYQEYLYETNNKIKKYNLESQWFWYDPVDNLHDIYGHYRALIHPSLLEGLPNVICEALSCGTPVLASNILDHPRLVKQGERGFLFDPTNSEEIANVIMEFLSLSEEKLGEIYENCTAYAQAELSIESIVNKYENAFRY